MRRWWGLCLVVTLVSSSLAMPAEGRPLETRHGGADPVERALLRYGLHSAFSKLGRGISNTLGGWLEIPVTIREQRTQADVAGSFFTGLTLGVFKTVVRTGVGVYEIVTFWLPLPEQYREILPTLEYFEERGRRRRPRQLE